MWTHDWNLMKPSIPDNVASKRNGTRNVLEDFGSKIGLTCQWRWENGQEDLKKTGMAMRKLMT